MTTASLSGQRAGRAGTRCPHPFDQGPDPEGVTSSVEVRYRHEYPAPVGLVWDVLMDPQVLAARLPGCKALQPVEDGVYQATMEISVGPVKGSFGGRVQLADVEPTQSYRLVVEGGGAPGTVRGEGRVRLHPQAESRTVVEVEGSVAVTGVLAGVGQRLLGSVARMMIERFFKSLEQDVLARASVEPGQA